MELSIVGTQTGARATEAPQVNGGVSVAQPDGEGGFILGGDFTCIGPTAQAVEAVGSCNPPNNRASGLARIRADGSVDQGLLPKLTRRDQPLGPSIYDLSVDGTTIRLAGDFTSVNGARRTGLAAISTSGELQPWAPRLGGEYPAASAIETANEGSILVGGSFDRVNGRKQRQLAKFTSDGNLADFRPPIRDSLFIADVAAFGKRIYVAAYALLLSEGRRGTRFRSAIALGPTGRLLNWNPFQTGKDGPTIASIEPYEGQLVFGGDFRKAAGKPRRGLAAFDSSGRLTDWAPRLGGNGAEARYLSALGGSIFVAGPFSQVNGTKRNGVAAIAADGQPTGWVTETPTNAPQVDIVTAAPERTLIVSSTPVLLEP